MKKKRTFLFVGLLIIPFIAIFTFLIVAKLTEQGFVMPDNLQEYSDDNFSFKYPQGAEVFKFNDTDERLGTIRIKTSNNIDIDLEHNVGSTESASDYVEQLYSFADNHKYNQSPAKIPNNNIQGDYATRFLQNEEFNILSEYAVFDTSKGQFQLKMGLFSDEQESYTQAHNDFLLILRTIEVK